MASITQKTRNRTTEVKLLPSSQRKDTEREKEMNGKKENERETEKDPETKRKGDRNQERNGDVQKWRSRKTSVRGHNGEKGRREGGTKVLL